MRVFRVLNGLPILLYVACMPEFYFSNYMIGDCKNGEISIFYRVFRENKGSLRVLRGAFGVINFFVIPLHGLILFQQLYYWRSPDGEIRIIVRTFRTNMDSLEVFRGALGVANFVISSSLYALNSISSIILLAIAKMAKLVFFSCFLKK